MTKRANTDLFRILKGIVDVKARANYGTWSQQAQQADIAQASIGAIEKTIAGLERYADRVASYDPADARETQQMIQDEQMKIVDAQKKIKIGEQAKEQIRAIRKFDNIYNEVIIEPQVRILEQKYNEVARRVDRLTDLICKCEINMDPNERGDEISQQYADDREQYQKEYDEAMAQMVEIYAQIRQLKH